MTKQCRQPPVGGPHRRLEALLARGDPQWQGIDEHPQRPFGAVTTVQAAHQHGAEDHIAAPGQARHHLAPGQMVQAGIAHPEASGLGPQALGQVRVHRQQRFLDAAAIALHILQAEGQGRLVDISEHFAEERLVLLAAHSQAGLGNMVAVRDRRFKFGATALAERLDLLAQQGQGGGVIDQVMEQQYRDPAAVVGILGIVQAHHRCLAQVQANPPWIEMFLQLSRHITLVRMRQEGFDPQPRLAPDHLDRFVELFPGHRGAQDIVTVDHRLQRFRKPQQLVEGVDPQQGLQQVRIALLARQVVIEDAFLQRYQRVDVLHIADTARDSGHQVVDLRLGQARQGQHVRGDVLAAGRNGIGRHDNLAALATGCRQRGQGRLAEQHADIGTQADLAHAFDQFHCQQRMPAQFEELVVTPHLLDTEQLGPESGQGGFRRALGGFVFTPGIGIGRRHREGLAIQLAVGGQRKTFQADKGAWQHVLGQRQTQLVTQLRGVQFDAGLADDIGHQALVARFVLAHQHHGVTYTFAGRQLRFDLTQFDTETANLHLFVVAPQVFQAAVGQPATQVAGAVHTRTRGGDKRIVEEARSVQFLAVEVTPGHARATDIQLPHHAGWQRLAVAVEQVQAQVGNPPADRAHAHTLGVFGLQRVIGHMHRGLGDAVHVHQLRGAVQFPGVPGFEHRRVQRFTAENHLAQ